MTQANPRAPKVFMLDLLATVPYYTAYLTRALLAEGVSVSLGSITYYLDPECFSSRGIPLRPGLLNFVGRFHLPRGLRRVFKLLESLLNMAALALRFLVAPPDILHVQYLPMLKWRFPLDLWLVLFCQRRGAKIVLTIHDLLPHDTGNTYRQTFMSLYARVDHMICHSLHIKTRLEQEFQVSASRIAVIPHGPFFYDLPGSRNTDRPADGKTIVLWQGILFPYKGVDLLLEAWKSVEETAPDAYLTVAGTGAPELLAAMEQQVVRLGLRRVTLTFRFITAAELVALYRAADIIVYPYRAITTSGALATGLALGKTIVASDLPVFRELLTDRENALLTDPASPASLAQALEHLIAHPETRRQLAQAVSAMNFGDASWRAIAHETAEVYRLMLEAQALSHAQSQA